jgi:hypothetical protein
MITLRATQRLLLVALLFAASGLSSTGQTSPPPIVALVDTTIDQVGVAIEHTVLASLAAGPEDLQLQVRQVGNVLVGQDDPRYDRGVPNPGDGAGILKRVQQLSDQLGSNDQTPDMARVAKRVLLYINLAIEHAQQALRAQHPNQAAMEIAHLLALLSAARGSSEDPLLQGGLRNLRAQLAGH